MMKIELDWSDRINVFQRYFKNLAFLNDDFRFFDPDDDQDGRAIITFLDKNGKKLEVEKIIIEGDSFAKEYKDPYYKSNCEKLVSEKEGD